MNATGRKNRTTRIRLVDTETHTVFLEIYEKAKEPPKHKLNAHKARAIRMSFLGGAPKTTLARQYDVSVATITSIIDGKTWKIPD